MAKKDFRKELSGIGGGAMGLIQPTTATTEQPQQVATPKTTATGNNQKKKVCFTLNEEYIKKLKIIGNNNNIPLGTLIDKAISKAIEQYEQANGQIIIKENKKQIEDIF